jgi:hypothetical protein
MKYRIIHISSIYIVYIYVYIFIFIYIHTHIYSKLNELLTGFGAGGGGLTSLRLV